jgi:hypothetical protein
MLNHDAEKTPLWHPAVLSTTVGSADILGSNLGQGRMYIQGCNGESNFFFHTTFKCDFFHRLTRCLFHNILHTSFL